MEHGFQGRYFDTYDVAKKEGLKFIFGTEAYWVKDRFEKDNTNGHMCLFAKSEKGRRDINRILSEANETGYYYKPRIDLDLISTLDPNEVFVTSACIAFWQYEDVEKIVLDLNSYFGKNFMLEVQAHHTETQKKLHNRILDISSKHNIELIAGCDSHFIYPEQAKDRDAVLEAKGIVYENEDGWFMDYPDGETLKRRFIDQGVLNEEQIDKAIKNTLVFMDFDDYDSDLIKVFSNDIKLPTLYPELSQEQRDHKYKQLLNEKWREAKSSIPKEKHAKYIDEIRKEGSVVVNTRMSDYFLIDHEIVKEAVAKGGIITPTGRGSGVSYYTNTLLGFSKVDRISAPVHLYPERFMSESRILETKSLPDLDLNLGNPEVFIAAQTKVLGEGHSYPMIAYGTFKRKSGFKLYAKSQNLDFEIANEVSKQLEAYENDLKYAEDDEQDLIDVYDYVDKKYHHLIKESEKYTGIISDKKPHPCFVSGTEVMTSEGYKNIEDIIKGDMVLTHTNTYKEVLHTMNKETDDIYQLKISGDPLFVTGNHPMYVITKKIASGGKVKSISEPYWKEVAHLEKNDLIGLAINEESTVPEIESLPVNKHDFWWFVGRYIGDGYSLIKSGSDYMTFISCDNKDINLIVSKVKDIFHYNNTKDKKSGNASTFYIYNKDLYLFLQQFGKYAHGKYLNKTIIDLPVDLLASFLEGYLSADGHLRNDEYTFKTVSKELALGLQVCVHKVYRKPCTIRTVEPTWGEINDKKFLRRKTYVCRFKTFDAPKDRNLYKYGLIWIQYKGKQKAQLEKTKVYNLEVKDDNSYTVNNFIAHNCGHLIYQGNIKEEIGLIRIKSESTKKEVIAALIDGEIAERKKFLKNDLLKVDVVKTTHDTYKRIGLPIHTETELLNTIKDNVKVWDIYAKGLTVGVNQVEKYSTTQKVMKYQPSNISELTAFIAAIRPSFKSMYHTFESRKPFTYGIGSFDDLIQTEEMKNSYVLYQEQTMATLAYAGFPSDETYGIIKAISKKKPDVVKPLKERFLKGFSDKILERETVTKQEAFDMSDKVWKIIEDSSGYGFNASHAYSYALDSVYCAYLKSHYPIYFYESLLRHFSEKKNKDKVGLLKEEMQKGFGIKDGGIKFGTDNRSFVADEGKNSIYADLSGIKFMNVKVAEELFEVGKNTYESFIDLLVDINLKTSVNARQLKILIMLNYFDMFGNNGYLSALFKEFSDGKYKFKKTYVEKTIEQRLIELKKIEDELQSQEVPAILPNETVMFQIEHMGYADVKYPDTSSGWCVVTDIDTKYSPKLTLYGVQKGETRFFKMSKKTFNVKDSNLRINIGDLIEITEFKKKMKSVPDGNGNFVETNQSETWITGYNKYKNKENT